MTRNISTVRRETNRQQRREVRPAKRAEEESKVVENEKEKEKSRELPTLYDTGMDDAWTPALSTVFKILVSLRMSAGIWSPISDCDEVYNYWEPLHLLLYGTGFQTWEYSPVYAIRSYAYVWLFSVPIRLFQTILPHTKVTSFFYLRCFFGFCCALSEAYLYRMVCRRFGNRVGRLFVVFTMVSAGMFGSCCAFLPSSFSMTLNFLAIAAWLDQRYFVATLAIAVSALVGWPFAAVLGLPIVLEMVLQKRKVMTFSLYAVVAGSLTCAFLIAVDSHFYGKWVLAPLNIVMYNVFTSHGPNLYGVEPLSYYVINCLLNWNLVFPLALVALPITALAFWQAPSRTSSPQWNRYLPVVYLQVTMFAWMLIFGSQPHKEERFLFPIYPFLSLSGALALDAGQRVIGRFVRRLDATLVWTLVLLFLALSGSRSVALYRNYHAPLDSYMALNERLSHVTQSHALPRGKHVTVCVGKEWYRFPSSFFLPTRTADDRGVRLQFIQSEFRGLLPKAYADVPLPNATRLIPTEMNDMNKEEPSRYVEWRNCQYLIDLDTPDVAPLEPNYSRMTTEWNVVHQDQFLIASKSHRLFRAFWIPILSDRYCSYGAYSVLERTQIK